MSASAAPAMDATARHEGDTARYGWAMAAGALLLLLISLMLPWSPRIAWQQAAGSDMFHARWVYDRIHNDPTPIDVAVIGSSRMEAAISPNVLHRVLSQRLGRSVSVANLSIVRPGRDLHAMIANDLLNHHPEVKLILLSDDGYMVSSHPLFREIASPAALIAAPRIINPAYFGNLLALPYRNIANLAGQMAPGWFGLQAGFDPARYEGPDLDRSEGYTLPSGHRRNGDLVMPLAPLTRDAQAAVALQGVGIVGKLPLPDRYKYAVDQAYVTTIADLARQHGTRIAFISLPVFGSHQLAGSTRFYQGFGPDFAFTDLAANPTLFQDGLHMNHHGALTVTARLADKIAPLLPTHP